MDSEKKELKPQDFFDARDARNATLQEQNDTSTGVISAGKVDKAKPINIPTATPKPVVADRIVSDISIPPEPAEPAPAPTQAVPEAESLRSRIAERQDILSELGLSDIKDSFENLMQKGAFTQQAEAEAGIDKKTIALNDINSKLRETDLKFRRRRESIETQTGLTSAQKNARIADVSREQARELADLSIIRATANDDLATAQALVDRKVELTFEPIEQRLKFQQAMFEENKEIFNEEEQRDFDIKMRDEQIKIDKDKFKFQQLENTKLSVMQEAKAYGASNEVIAAIQNAENEEQAFNAAGNYFGKAQRMALSLQSAQLDKIKADAQKAANAANASISADGKRVLSTEDADKLNKEIFKTDQYKALTGDSQKAIDALNEYEKIFNELGPNMDILPSSERNKLNTAFTNLKLYAKDFFALGVIAGPDEELLDAALGGKPTGFSVNPNTKFIREESIGSAINQFKQSVVNGISANVMSIEGAYGNISDQNIPAIQTIRSRKNEALTSIITDPVALEKTFDEELPDEEFFNTN